MAAPHVTGILALALSYSKRRGKRLSQEEVIGVMKETAFMPEISEGEVRDLIENTGFNLIRKDLGYKEFLRYVYGAGIIRADKIIERLT